ncbi:MAG: type II toxin-antitoxin system VapC family toxin [Spirochaetaceae bacterium]|nr:type II toxin-antitoxin system VapC family toxin [Spirochaetaceae bacterium]
MTLLLDTHILIWAATGMVPKEALPYIAAENNTLLFSPASIWEIVIKKGLNRPDFQVDPQAIYRGFLDHGYRELVITGSHTLTAGRLPPIHKDPFDRILIAQARTEKITFLTADETVARYPGDIIYVRK